MDPSASLGIVFKIKVTQILLEGEFSESSNFVGYEKVRNWLVIGIFSYL
jgi:hypothetical protein